MKRSIEQEISVKRTKLDHTRHCDHDQVPFSDDALELIMSFLWTRTLTLSCLCVSRQWHRMVTERSEKQFTIKDQSTWLGFSVSGFNQSDAPLSLSLRGLHPEMNLSLLDGRPNIKRLDMQYLTIRNIEQIKSLDNLETIRLLSCSVDITEIDPPLYKLINTRSIRSMSGLKKLKRLDVLSMKFTESKDDDANAGLGGFAALDRLSLAYSQISDKFLFNFIKLTQISYLDLSGCYFYGRVGEWSKHIPELINLTHLNLTNTKIVDSDMINISKMSALLTLDISRNSISALGFSFLPGLTNLTHLEANETLAREGGCLHISTMSNLEYLSIKSCDINHSGCSDLSRLSGLRHLDVSNNEIEGKGLSHLCSMSNLNSLGVLDCLIDSESAKQIQRLENLRHLEISISDDHELFQSWNQLETLRIYKVPKRDSTINSEPIQGSCAMDRLTTLCMRSASMTCTHAKQLVRLTQLTRLDVSNNSLGAEGAHQISKIETLIHLEISQARIGAEGVKSIVLKLKNLWHLDISSNSIEDESIEHIAQADNIGSLRCVCNSISEEGKKVIRLMKNIVSLEL